MLEPGVPVVYCTFLPPGRETRWKKNEGGALCFSIALDSSDVEYISQFPLLKHAAPANV